MPPGGGSGASLSDPLLMEAIVMRRSVIVASTVLVFGLGLAGPAWADKVSDLGPKGGTGVPVRTLVRYLLDRSA